MLLDLSHCPQHHSHSSKGNSSDVIALQGLMLEMHIASCTLLEPIHMSSCFCHCMSPRTSLTVSQSHSFILPSISLFISLFLFTSTSLFLDAFLQRLSLNLFPSCYFSLPPNPFFVGQGLYSSEKATHTAIFYLCMMAPLLQGLQSLEFICCCFFSLAYHSSFPSLFCMHWLAKWPSFYPCALHPSEMHPEAQIQHCY